ncbi:MAG: hydroxyisourate hydrolase [Edaphobacter sp.]
MMKISTHILDTGRGKPASNVFVRLDYYDRDKMEWIELNSAWTNEDGRIPQIFPEDRKYFWPKDLRLHFGTESYYQDQGILGFYPFVEIAFLATAGEEHYHIPLLLTANGYTTYRGS